MDFTDKLNLNVTRFYGGANGNKKAIVINGDIYMVKFPPKKEQLKIRYTNSCISEYIGSTIFKILGISAQDVILGTVEDKVVVACKDFTSPGIVLQDFVAIKNSCIESSNNGYGVELSEIKDAMNEQQAVPKEDVVRRFWDMFVVDALIGNFDRHNGNWGFLVNTMDNTARLAPVFACGSSLLPQADDTLKREVLLNEAEMNNRIYVFPNSAIKYNGEKINYYDFLISASDEDCNKAVKRIFPKIDIEAINKIIDECKYISELDKTFYSAYIQNRYNKILMPSLLKICEKESGEKLKQPKFNVNTKTLESEDLIENQILEYEKDK